jgi:hypothetical protein
MGLAKEYGNSLKTGMKGVITDYGSACYYARQNGPGCQNVAGFRTNFARTGTGTRKVCVSKILLRMYSTNKVVM